VEEAAYWSFGFEAFGEPSRLEQFSENT